MRIGEVITSIPELKAGVPSVVSFTDGLIRRFVNTLNEVKDKEWQGLAFTGYHIYSKGKRVIMLILRNEVSLLFKGI